MATKSVRAFRRDLGRRIKALRLAKGVSQRELAELADIAEKFLSRIEVGAVTPSMFVGARIAQALGVGLDALVAAKGPRPPDRRWLAVLRRVRKLEARHELDRAIALLDLLCR